MKVVFVDGNNITLSAAHAVSPLYDANSFPTSCIYASIRSLLKIAEELKPNRMIMFWDSGHSKYRQSIYPQYKFRPKLDEDDAKMVFLDEWKVQVKRLEEILPELGIGQIRLKGCEADDLIYSSTQVLKNADHITIVSSDLDFNQLLSDKCTIYNISTKNHGIRTYEDVFNEYEIIPEQWALLRAMTGDGSDNIDGVDGIGPKSASKILNEFPDLFSFFDIDPKLLETKYKKKIYTSLYQNRSVVDRNVRLMDLSMLPEGQVDSQAVQLLIYEALKIKPDKKAFWTSCLEHQMASLLTDSYKWGNVWKD